MKPVFRGALTLLLLGLTRALTPAQGAESYFHRAANSFINSQNAEARQTLQTGLQQYPADSKMRSLLKEIKDDEQKKQQEKNQQQQKEQQQKEQQKQKEPQQAKKESPPQESPAEDQEKPREKKPERQANQEKLKEMNLTQEKARMILDAMKTNEIQYLQQRRREKTQRTDNNKPDW